MPKEANNPVNVFKVLQTDDSDCIYISRCQYTKLKQCSNMMNSFKMLLQGTVQGKVKDVQNCPTEETKCIFAGFASTCSQTSKETLSKAFAISRVCLLKDNQINNYCHLIVIKLCHIQSTNQPIIQIISPFKKKVKAERWKLSIFTSKLIK